ncbi:Lipid phosphate phosphatase delta [Camellia lanceoleosa]|nr:Lipid phosphate phosphatase delta [Camellia lanceoleosa]
MALAAIVSSLRKRRSLSVEAFLALVDLTKGKKKTKVLYSPLLFWSGHGKLARQMTLLMAFCDYSGNCIKDVVSAPRPRCPPVRRVTATKDEKENAMNMDCLLPTFLTQFAYLDYQISTYYNSQFQIFINFRFQQVRFSSFSVLKYDVESERPRTKDLDTPELLEQLPALQQLLFRVLGCQRTKDLDTPELLEQLPALQQLLFRVLGCQPQGAAPMMGSELCLSLLYSELLEKYMNFVLKEGD